MKIETKRNLSEVNGFQNAVLQLFGDKIGSAKVLNSLKILAVAKLKPIYLFWANVFFAKVLRVIFVGTMVGFFLAAELAWAQEGKRENFSSMNSEEKSQLRKKVRERAYIGGKDEEPLKVQANVSVSIRKKSGNIDFEAEEPAEKSEAELPQ